jgi:hypothetical protein
MVDRHWSVQSAVPDVPVLGSHVPVGAGRTGETTTLAQAAAAASTMTTAVANNSSRSLRRRPPLSSTNTGAGAGGAAMTLVPAAGFGVRWRVRTRARPTCPRTLA